MDELITRPPETPICQPRSDRAAAANGNGTLHIVSAFAFLCRYTGPLRLGPDRVAVIWCCHEEVPMRIRSLVALVITAGVALPSVGAAQVPDTRPGIAVLPLDDGGSYGQDAQDFAALRVGLQQILMTELAEIGALRIVERGVLNEILTEQDLGASGRVNSATAAQIGNIVGARYMVLGSFIDLFGDFRIDVRIVNVETSEIIETERVRNKREDMYDMLVELASKLVQDVELTPLSAERQQQRRSRDIPAEAITRFGEALTHQDAGDEDKAVELYEAISRDFPELTEVREPLRQIRG